MREGGNRVATDDLPAGSLHLQTRQFSDPRRLRELQASHPWLRDARTAS
jgi:hypothetical protein